MVALLAVVSDGWSSPAGWACIKDASSLRACKEVGMVCSKHIEQPTPLKGGVGQRQMEKLRISGR